MRFESLSKQTSEIALATRCRVDVEQDAPLLLTLFDQYPEIVYTRSDPLYKQLSIAFNQLVSVEPLAIVRALEEKHVIATVKAARTTGLPLGVRSGGYDLAGRNVAGIESGIILDIRAIHSVSIAKGKASASIGGGILSGELAQVLHEHQLFTPVGWHPKVGYVGWAMGGGYGVYASAYGMGVDQIMAARLVLADGTAMVVDDENDSELLWALRGAGNGIWGVVTELTIKVYPSPKLILGAFVLKIKDWQSTLTEWAENIEPNLPTEFTGDMYIRNPNVHDPEICLYFAWCVKQGEDSTEGYNFLDKIKSLASGLSGRVSEMDFASFIKSVPSSQSAPVSLRGVVVKGFTTKVLAVLKEQYHDSQSIYIGSPSHFAHGLAIQPNDKACFPLRYRHRLLPLISRCDDMETDSAVMDAVTSKAEKMVRKLKATGDVLDGVAYTNLMPAIDTDIEATFGKETVARLRALKKTYDPDTFSLEVIQYSSLGLKLSDNL